jgi:hypothetical protein
LFTFNTPTGSIRCKYWTTVVGENGNGVQRVRKDVFICEQDDKHFAQKDGDGTWVFSNAVLQIRDRLMLDVNERQTAFHQKIEVKGITGTGAVYGNIRTIQGFYENVYLPWAMSELRRSTVRSYSQIWRTYLKAHFEANLPRLYDRHGESISPVAGGTWADSKINQPYQGRRFLHFQLRSGTSRPDP